MLSRFLARQFARPSGLLGRFWIAPWLDRISREMNALALRELRLAGGERVLEVGFGGGGLIAMMLDAGAAQVTGVDVSEAALARARRRFGKEAEIVHASAEALPFADSAFDAAVSLNSLYFWPDVPGAFAELARVVRPGGRLVIGFEPAGELRKWPGHRFGFKLFEAEEVAGLASAAGFEALRFSEGRGRKPDRFLCLSGKRGSANV